MKKNTIMLLLMVSLVLFSMIAIGSAEETSTSTDNEINDSEKMSEIATEEQSTTESQLGEFFAQYGEVKWANGILVEMPPFFNYLYRPYEEND